MDVGEETEQAACCCRVLSKVLDSGQELPNPEELAGGGDGACCQESWLQSRRGWLKEILPAEYWESDKTEGYQVDPTRRVTFTPATGEIDVAINAETLLESSARVVLVIRQWVDDLPRNNEFAQKLDQRRKWGAALLKMNCLLSSMEADADALAPAVLRHYGLPDSAEAAKALLFGEISEHRRLRVNSFVTAPKHERRTGAVLTQIVGNSAAGTGELWLKACRVADNHAKWVRRTTLGRAIPKHDRRRLNKRTGFNQDKTSDLIDVHLAKPLNKTDLYNRIEKLAEQEGISLNDEVRKNLRRSLRERLARRQDKE